MSSSCNEDVIIDLRSDTITLPTAEMRQVMAEAIVGDDVLGEDPTVILLQEKISSITGKEAALFVPSGTMSNLIAIMVHCSGRGEEIILGDLSHIALFEQGGSATIAGVHHRTVKNLPNGELDLAEVESKIRPQDPHLPITRLICTENTHSQTGGKVLSLEYMQKAYQLAKKHNLFLHLDGARLFNAATSLNVPISKLAECADSINICLSKGLAAPVGSLIIGSREFIQKAHRIRKVLGGGMRQAGILAAAGLVAIDTMSHRLNEDHLRAKQFATKLSEFRKYGLEVDIAGVHSNMVLFYIYNENFDANKFSANCDAPNKHKIADNVCQQKARVRLDVKNSNMIRTVFTYHISDDDVYLAIETFRAVFEHISRKVSLVQSSS